MREPAPTGARGRALAALASLRRAAARPAVARPLVALTVVALAVGSVSAARSLPDGVEVRWWLVVLVGAVGTPATVALNALEYRASARAVGVDETLGTAARVSIYGTAANLLPLPGGSLVRIDAIRRRGGSMRSATSITIAVGLLWLGASLVMAGGLGATTTPGLAVVFLLAGVAPLVAAHLVMRRLGSPPRAFVVIAAVQVAAVSVQALRFWLAAAAIDADLGPSQAFALGVSVTVAAAAGFLPGGLGIREAIAAALGPLIGLTASQTFLATLVDRIAGLAAVTVVAVVVMAATRGEARRLLDQEAGNLAAPDDRSTSPP
ncbi:lysylphosphatidylglycerol synthase domain-containing protein [Actinomarinicola tropica]|uniref:Uncharacterized protein n=1 Tax=Actinomarinicola tropica TaxID=2789776 RepID=A0A5Q2RN73_9ACTN|nr:lysylphosphatidylglycerol synthase domain-containing protein [Actinomarinicola tropica]QGG95856.1 hypothetical protein GH723_12525 [Actinomarinicola tropica]